ncbi:MAG: hypothetical protein CM15mP17_06850 [Gammaproteobacteria bacterium]|nr:MAG: hypothetical protein CM15mP17_06850 [Gammaproteobacteria bacterium]
MTINLISSVIAGMVVPIILRKLNQDPAIAGECCCNNDNGCDWIFFLSRLSNYIFNQLILSRTGLLIGPFTSNWIVDAFVKSS